MSNQDKKSDPAVDRRKKTRYVIGPSFRLKAVLSLHDESGRSSGSAWKDWRCTLVDLSATGAHVQLNLAAVAFPESACRLKISHGSFKLEMPGTVAHYVCSARYAVCGIRFDFANASVEKAYFRVLEPVIIGATLVPVEAKSETFGRHKEQFGGKLSSLLTVWRASPGGELTGFSFRMNKFAVEADRVGGGGAISRSDLKFKLITAEIAGSGEIPLPPTESQEQEVRWMFSLAATNLSTAVPADVRNFLLALA